MAALVQKHDLLCVVFNDVDAFMGNLETASPTTSRLSRSLLLSVSANLRWRAWSADVSTGFLQGLPQERKLWLKLSNEALQILGATANTRIVFYESQFMANLMPQGDGFLKQFRRLKSLGWQQHAA